MTTTFGCFSSHISFLYPIGNVETEKRKIADAEAAKQCALMSERISEEEPSIPFDDIGERIIVRDGKTYKQWFELGFGTDILYREEEIVDE